MFCPLGYHNSIGRQLEEIDPFCRVCLAMEQFCCAAIGAVTQQPEPGFAGLFGDMTGKASTATLKLEIARGHEDQPLTNLGLAVFAAGFFLVRRLLASMKSITKGRILLRQLRPAKMP